MELQGFGLNYIEKWLPEASVKYKDGSYDKRLEQHKDSD